MIVSSPMVLAADMIKIQVCIKKDDKAKFEELAKMDGRSLSNWVYQAMRDKAMMQKGNVRMIPVLR